MTKIIYNQDNGIVCIINPIPNEINPETGNVFTTDEIIKLTVPKGKKYKKIEDSEVPTDRTFRDAWTVDESDLTDGVGA
tara:strand:+ start:1171 stop:1407 length:237 start_codon:yes stop_codon:yes gene_type:complete